MSDYWYDNRQDLCPGMVFITHTDEVVMLDRRVPGDGSKWYVADLLSDGKWGFYDGTNEPGDLKVRV